MKSEFYSKWMLLLCLLLAGAISIFIVQQQPESTTLTTELLQPDQVSIPEAGLVISSDADLGKTKITVTEESAMIHKQQSIERIVNIQPQKDEDLNATLIFEYNEKELNGLDESSLILYSSENNGKTWIAHHNSEVDPMTNSIHLSGIEHFSLWTAALPPPDPGGIATDLILWLKADDGVLTGDGTAVSLWTDQSSAGNNVDQAVAVQQPTFYSSTPDELLNFNPSLSFDGLDDLKNGFNYGDDRFFSNTSAYTVFTVGQDRRTNLAELRATIGIGDNGNDPAIDLQTDGISPNGLNIFFDGSSPAEQFNSTLLLYNGNTGGDNVQPQIFGVSSPNTTGGGLSSDNVTAHIDGESELTNMDSYQISTIGQNVFVGSSADAFWLGNIAEVVVYEADLSTTEKQQVQSYLALKYGITLGQTAPISYLDGAGATIWDATANTTYSNDIAGIGQDDASSLLQKQSQSVNENSQPAFALGDQTAGFPTTNAANTASFASTGNFMIWGNNGMEETYSTPYAPNSFTPAAGYFIMPAVWLVEEIGTVNTVTVKGPENAEHLLVHSSADFSTGSPTEILLADDGNGNMVATVDLTDGEYFTFGAEIEAPGCVAG
ncbi:MAG: hypothetical protein AAF599_12515, partial [Bacteroidota bacterium]